MQGKQEVDDMIRKIIHIDEEKCNGCGLCAAACHEGAIDMVGGKAKLVRENYCDGLGDCLPGCPTGAITFEEREAPAYDDTAVKKTQEESRKAAMTMTTEKIMKIEDENERRKLMTAKMKEEGSMHHAHGGACITHTEDVPDLVRCSFTEKNLVMRKPRRSHRQSRYRVLRSGHVRSNWFRRRLRSSTGRSF